jgi:hypothetical protein
MDLLRLGNQLSDSDDEQTQFNLMSQVIDVDAETEVDLAAITPLASTSGTKTSTPRKRPPTPKRTTQTKKRKVTFEDEPTYPFIDVIMATTLPILLIHFQQKKQWLTTANEWKIPALHSLLMIFLQLWEKAYDNRNRMYGVEASHKLLIECVEGSLEKCLCNISIDAQHLQSLGVMFNRFPMDTVDANPSSGQSTGTPSSASSSTTPCRTLLSTTSTSTTPAATGIRTASAPSSNISTVRRSLVLSSVWNLLPQLQNSASAICSSITMKEPYGASCTVTSPGASQIYDCQPEDLRGGDSEGYGTGGLVEVCQSVGHPMPGRQLGPLPVADVLHRGVALLVAV